jgi:integrase
LKYSTGEKILATLWNPEEQRARETKKFPEYPEFNSYLTKIESTIKTVYRTFLNDDVEITTKLLKNELDIQLNKSVKKKKETLFEFIESYIIEQKNIKSSGTIWGHKTTLKCLKKYCLEKNCTLDFEDINLVFYNSFISYMTEKLNYAQNTIANQIKHLKVFLNEATERGINKNYDFKSRKFKKVSVETDKIYLNVKEIKKIYNLDLSATPDLEKMRDLFILGCYTGLRFSDFIQINNGNIIDGNKIKIRTQKTSETVVIPVHPFVKEILNKYNGIIQTLPSNKDLNSCIRTIGELAKIKEMVNISTTRGGKIEKKSVEKYSLISSHTARRSFASNLFLADVPSITIMKITGHKSEKSFLKYIRISQEENANKLLDHPFFK